MKRSIAIAGNMGYVEPLPDFLPGLRSLCDRHGALLVLDEVMTGFRVARNCAQGLFGIEPDEDRKRALPPLPTRIGVITSRSGAAVRDIITVLGRRFPAAPVVIYPAAVQGDAAPAELIAALEAVGRRPDVARLTVDEAFSLPEVDPDAPPALAPATATHEIDTVRAPAAWHALGITGAGVTVAFLDSGNSTVSDAIHWNADNQWRYLAQYDAVTDTLTGFSKAYNNTSGESLDYSNPLGQPANAVTDNTAFATCP